MPELTSDIVDAHVHVTFATHGANPAPPGSTEIQEIYRRAQAAAGVTLVRDCRAVSHSAPPPSGPGLPKVISCGPLIAPDVPFLAHLRDPVAADQLVEVACQRIPRGAR